tara:strand:- start:99 stop:641 length:543 start_codon:yes stop_codon:yes gene_type:complete
MIKNAILDDIDLFKRKVVHDDALINVKSSLKSLEKNAVVTEEENVKEKPIDKKVHFEHPVIKPECPNGVTCKDYDISEESGASLDEQTNMKELYDFVFDEDKKDTVNLNTFFPENVTDETVVDNTELHRHTQSYSKERAEEKESLSHNCNFEVIGMIEMNSGEDNIDGLDTLTSNYFSNL